MRNLFASELVTRARIDSRIHLLTCDLGFGVLDDFAKELPNNFLNLGITEQATMSLAAGMAQKGLRPFVYSIANFPTFRCLEQIRNDVNAMNLPVTIVSVGAGLGYGKAGYSHFAIEDISAMRTLKNIRIFNPSNQFELIESLNEIINSDSPAYLRIGGKLSSPISFESHSHSNEEPELTIVFTGDLDSLVSKAVKRLEFLGIRVRMTSIYRLENNVIDEFLLANQTKIISVEEHVLSGGFSSLLLERCNDLAINSRIHRVGISEIDPHLVGDQNFLREKYGLTEEAIVKSALLLLGRNT